jgi:glycine/D-amino acid oxidase-like deaminating enzyme
MTPVSSPSPKAHQNAANQALADARPFPFWLDGPDAPAVHAPLIGDEQADLVVVGGGYSGLWTALLAKERDPGRDVVLLERESCPSGASGRNGGMMLGSLVEYSYLPYYKGQEKQLVDIARENMSQLQLALSRYAIDCDFELNGWVMAATKPWQLTELEEIKRTGELGGMTSILWNADEMQAEVHSPELLGGVFQPDLVALVHPGKLAWGLKRACEQLGVRFFEFTPATAFAENPGGVRVDTPYGTVTARNAVLATYAHPSLIKSLRAWRIPIYSHVLATEPLTSEQMASIGWAGRQGIIDLDPYFCYYRPTADNRIIWGIVDATLHRGRAVSSDFEQDLPLFSTMARQFASRFPQLEGVRFTHRWGGALDNTSRAAPFFGTVAAGRVAYCHGFSTGVGATRAGAEIMLDLLAGRSTPYTQLPLVSGRGLHGRPFLRPYPPEPFLSIGMRLVQHAIAKEAETGHRHWTAKALNRLGYIF